MGPACEISGFLLRTVQNEVVCSHATQGPPTKRSTDNCSGRVIPENHCFMEPLRFSRRKVQDGSVQWENILLSDIGKHSSRFHVFIEGVLIPAASNAANTNDNLVHFSVFQMFSSSVSVHP